MRRSPREAAAIAAADGRQSTAAESRRTGGLTDARKRQIRGTRQPKPNSRAGATPRRYIATIVSTTRRGHRSRGKLSVPDPAAFCRAIRRIATHAASPVIQPESCEMDDNQQSHRRQEVAARARRSGSPRPRPGRNATAHTANEPRCRCPGCRSARPLPDRTTHRLLIAQTILTVIVVERGRGTRLQWRQTAGESAACSAGERLADRVHSIGIKPSDRFGHERLGHGSEVVAADRGLDQHLVDRSTHHAPSVSRREDVGVVERLKEVVMQSVPLLDCPGPPPLAGHTRELPRRSSAAQQGLAVPTRPADR